MNRAKRNSIDITPEKLSWAGGGFLIGFASSLILTYFMWIQPLSGDLADRRKDVARREEVLAEQARALEAMKQGANAEMFKLVADVNDFNSRARAIEAKLHEQEVDLTGAATSHVVVALLAILGLLGYAAFVSRDTNASAAYAMQTAVSLLPALSRGIRDAQGGERLAAAPVAPAALGEVENAEGMRQTRDDTPSPSPSGDGGSSPGGGTSSS